MRPIHPPERTTPRQRAVDMDKLELSVPDDEPDDDVSAFLASTIDQFN